MTSRLRSESGFTLVELLVVCAISVVIFGATLTAWTSFYSAHRGLERQHDNVETARVALDRAARQLRNLANPTVNAVKTIDLAQDNDFIFQTSDPNKTWVRYCLRTSGGGATLDQAQLYESESPGAISAAMRGPCPGTGWSKSRIVADHVTNQAGADRNVFTYKCELSAGAGCPSGIADYPKITSVGASLWVDADRRDHVRELQVSTGVYLRNQNEAPTAAVSWSALGTRKVLLNGSGSSDPEQRTLQYFWFEGAPPSNAELTGTPCTAPFPSAKWQGVTYTREWPASPPPPTTQTFYLVVRDPGCLVAQAVTNPSVKVPS